MAAEPSRLSAPVFRLREDELPPELILSIERILDLHTQGESDPLSRLTNDFNPIGVLNDYFPDGEPSTCCSSKTEPLNYVMQRPPLGSSKRYNLDLRKTSVCCRAR